MLDTLDSLQLDREIDRIVNEMDAKWDWYQEVASEYRRAARRKVRARVNEKLSTPRY